MYALVSLALFICWMFSKDANVLIASGIFAVADGIKDIAIEAFKNK